MKLRPATPADARAIADVNVRSWQAAYAGMLPAAFLQGLSGEGRVPFWKTVLGAGSVATFVAETEGRIGAFITSGACRDDRAPASAGEISALYALPELWGRGAGRELMRLAAQHLQAAGFAEVSLWVLARNLRARAFYEAAGFTRRDEASRHQDIGGARIEELGYLRAFDRPEVR